MHEWALAQAIIDAAVDVATREDARRIVEINIVLGELQTIDKEILRVALENIKKDTIARDAAINFESEKMRFRCNLCGHEWGLDKLDDILNENEIESIHFIPELVHAFVRCPNCGGSDYEIVAGRGVYIKSIRVEK